MKTFSGNGLSMEHVSKQMGATTFFRDLNLYVSQGKHMVVVGEPQRLKLLFHLISGLEPLDKGEIYCNGRLLNSLPPVERPMKVLLGPIFLYPHLTVRSNILFGIKMRKLSAKEMENRVDWVAEQLGIRNCLDKKMKALSLEQSVRCGIARAMSPIQSGEYLLLLEPFRGLAPSVAETIYHQTVNLCDQNGNTLILGTSHPELLDMETVFLSDLDGEPNKSSTLKAPASSIPKKQQPFSQKGFSTISQNELDNYRLGGSLREEIPETPTDAHSALLHLIAAWTAGFLRTQLYDRSGSLWNKVRAYGGSIQSARLDFTPGQLNLDVQFVNVPAPGYTFQYTYKEIAEKESADPISLSSEELRWVRCATLTRLVDTVPQAKMKNGSLLF